MAIPTLPLIVAVVGAVEGNPPKPTHSGNAPSVGGPTNPSLARGQIANTSISFTNSNLAHVCDISGGIKYSIAWVSFQIKQAIEAIRTYVQGLFASTSSSPFADGVRAVITAIQGQVKLIQKLIKKAQEVQAQITGYIIQLQKLIVYIESLPARIASILTQCIKDALSSINGAISNATAIVNSQKNGGLSTASAAALTASTQLTTAQQNNSGSSSGPAFQKP